MLPFFGVQDGHRNGFPAGRPSGNCILVLVYLRTPRFEKFQRSQNFGRTVAERIFSWSTTDGSLTVYPPYVQAALPLWQPTAPNPTAVFAPYWGNNRLFVQGSLTGTSSPAPPPYSTVPGSAYYNMVKEVYDISQTLTPEQSATTLMGELLEGRQVLKPARFSLSKIG